MEQQHVSGQRSLHAIQISDFVFLLRIPAWRTKRYAPPRVLYGLGCGVVCCTRFGLHRYSIYLHGRRDLCASAYHKAQMQRRSTTPFNMTGSVSRMRCIETNDLERGRVHLTEWLVLGGGITGYNKTADVFTRSKSNWRLKSIFKTKVWYNGKNGGKDFNRKRKKKRGSRRDKRLSSLLGATTLEWSKMLLHMGSERKNAFNMTKYDRQEKIYFVRQLMSLIWSVFFAWKPRLYKYESRFL